MLQVHTFFQRTEWPEFLLSKARPPVKRTSPRRVKEGGGHQLPALSVLWILATPNVQVLAVKGPDVKTE